MLNRDETTFIAFTAWKWTRQRHYVDHSEVQTTQERRDIVRKLGRNWLENSRTTT